MLFCTFHIALEVLHLAYCEYIDTKNVDMHQ